MHLYNRVMPILVCAHLGRAEDEGSPFLEKLAGIHFTGSEVMTGAEVPARNGDGQCRKVIAFWG